MAGVNSKIYVNCRFSLGLCNSLRRFNFGAFRQESNPQSATAYICGTLTPIFDARFVALCKSAADCYLDMVFAL
jgi:hypothetical protein